MNYLNVLTQHIYFFLILMGFELGAVPSCPALVSFSLLYLHNLFPPTFCHLQEASWELIHWGISSQWGGLAAGLWWRWWATYVNKNGEWEGMGGCGGLEVQLPEGFSFGLPLIPPKGVATWGRAASTGIQAAQHRSMAAHPTAKRWRGFHKWEVVKVVTRPPITFCVICNSN